VAILAEVYHDFFKRSTHQYYDLNLCDVHTNCTHAHAAGTSHIHVLRRKESETYTESGLVQLHALLSMLHSAWQLAK
jgi:hypothetical protein